MDGGHQHAGPSRWWRRRNDTDVQHSSGNEHHELPEVTRDRRLSGARAADGDLGPALRTARRQAPKDASDKPLGCFKRMLAQAVKVHGTITTATSAAHSSNESGRHPSISSQAELKVRAVRHGSQHGENWVWASRVSNLPASLSEVGMAATAHGEKGSNRAKPGRRQRTLDKDRMTASDSGATAAPPPGSINCIVVDQDFTTYISPECPALEDNCDGRDDEGQVSEDMRRSHADIEASAGLTTLSDSHSHRRSRYASFREYWHRRVIPALKSFADLSFDDPATESAFQKEQWYNSRPGAFLACLYIVVFFIGTLALQSPWTMFHKYTYPGICGLLTLPLPFLVVSNLPIRNFWVYQWGLLCASWVWAYVFIIEMRRCFFFGPNNACHERRYLEVFSTAQGLPTLALIALRQNRVLHSVAASVWLIITLCLFHDQQGVPGVFFRNVCMCALFNYFMAGVSFFRERADRKLYALRAQLKAQYKAVQNAQAMERRAEHSKKRFVSYIFHEVRVPLNTARLALANLDGERAFHDMTDDHKDLILGLDGSLRMMEKVLNDVLSFNRMESGNLTLARKPFSFHCAVRYVGLAHRSTAEMVGLDFDLDLDPRIDTIGGVVLGDEMRFKQVCSNLISNAFKFTHKGGVRLVTRLLYPQLPAEKVQHVPMVHHSNGGEGIEDAESPADGRSPEHVPIMLDVAPPPDQSHPSSPMSTASPTSTGTTAVAPRGCSNTVIRVEVHDTGVGISVEDVRDNRLFSPYVQTEIGRRQGGKGSGLGLALVTQIVKLSGGRLGVDSEPGKGSVFWFELPYFVPPTIEDLPNLTTPSEELVAPLLFSGRQPENEKPSRQSQALPQPSDEVQPNADNNRHCGPADQEAASSGRATSQSVVDSVPLQYLAPIPTTEPAPPATLDDGLVGEGELGLTTSTLDLPADLAPPGITTEEPGPETSATIATSHASLAEEDLPQVQLQAAPPAAALEETAARPWLSRAAPPRQLPQAHQGSVLPTSPVTPFRLSGGTIDENKPLNTLVVDDDPLTRKLMARMLKRLGHKVIQAEDGRSGLDLILRSWQGTADPIDIVFLDNQMPHMFGVEVVREVRKRGCLTFIVGCTGNALREDQDEYLVAGADNVIPKPVHETAIREQLVRVREQAAAAAGAARSSGGADAPGSKDGVAAGGPGGRSVGRP